MTDWEDLDNEKKNIEMQNCIHEPVNENGIRCKKCGGVFVLIHKPRTFKPRRIEVEDYG